MLMASKRAILAVALAVVVVAAAGAVIWQHEQPKVQAEPAKVIEWSSEELPRLPGQYVDESGAVIIDPATWRGDVHDLITLWDARQTPFSETHILKYIISVQAQPGETIRAVDFALNVGQNTREYYGWDLEEYGQIDCRISCGGQVLHNSLSDVTVTVDDSGHAEVSFIALNDGIHMELWFNGAPVSC